MTQAGALLEYHRMTSQAQSIISELEASVQSGSSDKRLGTLRRVADLFLNDVEVLNDEQIKVFDDVLCHLMKHVESKALAELSGQLAGVEKGPDEVIRQLARHDEIAVAGPVLAESKKLTTADLADIARTKGQGHLLAISGRDGLEEAVSDVLVERGDRAVVLRLADNATAHFSDGGYGRLVDRAEHDDALTEKVAVRADIPPRLQRELLSRATDAVRARLLALAPPQAREQISQVLATISGTVANEVVRLTDFSAAERQVRALHKQGKLDEGLVCDFAKAGKHEELAVALSVLSLAPVKTVSDLLCSPRYDAVLVPCRSAGLSWPTVEVILRHRVGGALPGETIALAHSDFDRLSVATAQRTMRFLQVRSNVA